MIRGNVFEIMFLPDAEVHDTSDSNVCINISLLVYKTENKQKMVKVTKKDAPFFSRSAVCYVASV